MLYGVARCWAVLGGCGRFGVLPLRIAVTVAILGSSSMMPLLCIVQRKRRQAHSRNVVVGVASPVGADPEYSGSGS